LIVIDSSQRNKTLYSNNNRFEYQCQKEYYNGKRLSLQSAIIPNTQYVINDNNNQINVTRSSTLYTANITKQNYNPTSLATQIQTALNALAIPSTTFTVTVDTNALKYTIVSTQAVTYNWSMNTIISQMLGFPITDSSSVTTTTSTNVYNISTTRYYKIRIGDEYQSEHDTNILGSKFHFIIQNDSNSGSYTYINNTNNVNTVYDITKRNPMKRLMIELYDEWNNLVNLNGSEYILIFKIEY
jgi:hypothetical protein